MPSPFTRRTTRVSIQLQHMLKVIEAQKPDGLMFLGWMPGIAGKNFQSFIDRFSDIPLVSVGVKLTL